MISPATWSECSRLVVRGDLSSNPGCVIGSLYCFKQVALFSLMFPVSKMTIEVLSWETIVNWINVILKSRQIWWWTPQKRSWGNQNIVFSAAFGWCTVNKVRRHKFNGRRKRNNIEHHLWSSSTELGLVEDLAGDCGIKDYIIIIVHSGTKLRLHRLSCTRAAIPVSYR